MGAVRSRLTYANVVSTIALFLVLGGATAFAARHLAAKSVGSAQLKPGAVSTAKLGAGAVTGAKIADGAVSAAKLGGGAVSAGKIADGAVGAAKLADGSVSAAKLDASVALPAVRRLVGNATLEFPLDRGTNTTPIEYPLVAATDVQPAGEDELIVASIQVKIPASCVNARFAEAVLYFDKGSGQADEIVGRAFVTNNHAGEETVTAPFVAGGSHGDTTPAPSKTTSHSFTIMLQRGDCNGKSGIASGIVVTGAQIDLIGLR